MSVCKRRNFWHAGLKHLTAMSFHFDLYKYSPRTSPLGTIANKIDSSCQTQLSYFAVYYTFLIFHTTNFDEYTRVCVCQWKRLWLAIEEISHKKSVTNFLLKCIPIYIWSAKCINDQLCLAYKWTNVCICSRLWRTDCQMPPLSYINEVSNFFKITLNCTRGTFSHQLLQHTHARILIAWDTPRNFPLILLSIHLLRPNRLRGVVPFFSPVPALAATAAAAALG